MIALWMVYATIIATTLGLAAAIVERAGTTALRQRRWIWSVALLLSVGIPLAVAFLPDGAASVSSAAGANNTSERGVSASPTGGTAIASRVAELLAAADTESLGRFDTAFAIAWAIAALLALTAYGVATWTLQRRRRSWRSAVVDGEPVLLSSAVGPAVIGAVRPAIVVPEWSLSLSAEQRALMIEHERQHVHARDPLMLHAAALVALLMPWNVAIWWLNRRLRLAVELDCDARVLAGGRDAGAYGMLLLDVCSRRTPPAAVLAPALLERTSSLAKRILAMQPAPVPFARSRLALGTLVAVGIVVLACDVPTPEMLAPDGQNVAAKRLYGTVSDVVPVDGIPNLRSVVQRYFPSVARGEGGPAILFVVRSSAGAIVMTEAQPASELSRMPGPRSRAGGESGALRVAPGSATTTATRLRAGAPLTAVGKVAPGENAAGPSTLRAKVRRSGIPSGIGAIEPNEIASIDIAKHAAGVLAPDAVSVIVISLKPGASVPRSTAP